MFQPWDLISRLHIAQKVHYENPLVPTVIRDNCQQPGCSFSGTRHRLSLLKMPISLCLLLCFHSKDLSSFTSGCEGIIYNLAEHGALKNVQSGEPTPALLLGRWEWCCCIKLDCAWSNESSYWLCLMGSQERNFALCGTWIKLLNSGSINLHAMKKSGCTSWTSCGDNCDWGFWDDDY